MPDRADADLTDAFEAERSRLTGLASRMLADPVEAQDVVQQAWLRLHGTDADIANLPGWLTTVTTRLCLDRLRTRVPVPTDELVAEAAPDLADDAVLAGSVGAAMHVVLDRLSPGERVAFVLHDSFGFDFPAIASMLDTTPAAARKLASRARAKVAGPGAGEGAADWEVVDAFMAAAREGAFERLLQLLHPEAEISADAAAVAAGTPTVVRGRREVAEFFNGSAHAALAAFVGDRPAAAWYHRGAPRVVFDFEVAGGVVRRVVFRAEPKVLESVRRRDGGDPRD